MEYSRSYIINLSSWISLNLCPIIKILGKLNFEASSSMIVFFIAVLRTWLQTAATMSFVAWIFAPAMLSNWWFRFGVEGKLAKCNSIMADKPQLSLTLWIESSLSLLLSLSREPLLLSPSLSIHVPIPFQFPSWTSDEPFQRPLSFHNIVKPLMVAFPFPLQVNPQFPFHDLSIFNNKLPPPITRPSRLYSYSPYFMIPLQSSPIGFSLFAIAIVKPTQKFSGTTPSWMPDKSLKSVSVV